MKKIAIVTPVYNREKYLVDCVESVAAVNTQKLFRLEHIVVDDYSTDGTRSYLDSVQYGHVVKILLDKNAGPARSRNIGIRNSDADYIFCLDSDDILLANGLRYFFQEGQAQNADWIYGDALTVGETLNYLIGQDYHGSDFLSAIDLLAAIYTKKHVFFTNSLYRRDLLLRVGGYDEDLKDGENAELAVRLILAGTMPKYLATTITLRRVHQGNLSLKNILVPQGRIADLRVSFQKNRPGLKEFLPPEKFLEIETFLKEHD